MNRLATWMPEPDVSAAYSIDIAAPRATVHEALLTTDFSRHPVIAVLMALRSLPALVARPRAPWKRLRRQRSAIGEQRTEIGIEELSEPEAPIPASQPPVADRRSFASQRLPLNVPLGESFARLEERPLEEIVLGLTGRFWTASGEARANRSGDVPFPYHTVLTGRCRVH
jgi:hypothetical protein